MKTKIITLLLLRYLALLLIGIGIYFTGFFYNIFLALTIYPASFLLGFFYNSSVIENMIIVNSLAIEIIPACVAISAYFLLLILNLTTAMKIKTRVYSILCSFLALLLVNVLRIVILSSMYVEKFAYFEQIHLFFWYVLSTIFVVCIWFGTAYVFKIKNIPVYSDIRRVLK